MAKNIQNINKSVQDAIDNYGKQIQTMKDFVSAVRQVPGMYIGPIGNRGFLNMFRETFQNSVDQLVLQTTSCDHIYVYYNEITHQVIVEDTGLGLPFNDMIRILTSQHTSKNYTKVKGEYSSGLNGIGIKVVNALSSKFIAESFRYDGEARKIEMIEGYATTKEPLKIPNKEKRQGTRIIFFPCEDVLGDITLEWKSIYHLVKHIVSMTPIGSVVDFEAIDSNNASHKEKIVNTDGIITDLIMKTKFPLIKPIVLSEDNGDQRLEIAFCYDGGGEAGPDPNESVTSFCNFCPTTAGTHVDGSVDGICRWFTNYMNKIYLSGQKSKQKTVVNAADIKSGLNIMINAASLEPIFTGQAKEVLSNEEMAPFAKNVISNGLDQWSKSNPQDLSKLSKYFKDIAELRMKNEAGKAKIVTKYQQNTLTGLPAKYAKPTEEDRELIIVEGDSAGGSAKVGRDVRYQGIFPIRGKISSAFEKTYHEFWNNAETQGIARIILNKDYTRKFDPVKDVKWDKIIFMADADVDGSHIASLLLRFFILYMPQLIEAGKVYKAIPPLYGFINGKKIQYLTDQVDFVRYVQKSFIQNNTIKKNKKQLSGKELTVLFLVNEDYVYEIERLSTTYAVDPRLLEIALFSYYNKTAIGALKKTLKSEFRFMDVSKEANGNMLFSGTIKESNFLFMNDRLAKDCQRVLKIIEKNDSIFYEMNGKESSLYEIMKAFDNSTPSNIKRYKGLGEMDADQLAESTLRPDSDRTLIRYTLEDAKEEIEAIRDFESDRTKLLNFVGTVKRSDLLD